MKILSWNVNGFKAVLSKNFLKLMEDEDPDMICMQETKCDPKEISLFLPGYSMHWNPAQKKGYSGTAIFTKHSPISVMRGIGEPDIEGRVLSLEFEKFWLVSVYAPNSQRGLSRLDYKLAWNKQFRSFLLSLSKPVIFCGDMNVAHEEIDIARPKENRLNAGFTDQERAAFSELLASGFVDPFRMFNKEPGNYTWWSYMFDARRKNIGWRIDYFCVSESLRDDVENSKILSDVPGSDHCPISLLIA